MKRKHKRTLGCTVALMTLGGISVMATETPATESPATNPPPKPIILRATTGSNKRPKAPSLQQITCVYDGENLHFDFVLPEGECSLTLTGGVNAAYTFDSSELNAEVYVGGIEDETQLTLTTEYGHLYSGTLEF